ncbi:hypothetical protein HNR42_000363 [Deinobacterium chartae]|uniref:Uncharacterized protein n=1 Tax=Deinobacterium chartae TaxID=521158 RepID=A0A841HU41_9DEIO|nr:hypothetical protein [Deinobacterium chartae]MBB6096951.1 hypothetical protein [Deinobacterium chartae]
MTLPPARPLKLRYLPEAQAMALLTFYGLEPSALEAQVQKMIVRRDLEGLLEAFGNSVWHLSLRRRLYRERRPYCALRAEVRDSAAGLEAVGPEFDLFGHCLWAERSACLPALVLLRSPENGVAGLALA